VVTIIALRNLQTPNSLENTVDTSRYTAVLEKLPLLHGVLVFCKPVSYFIPT